MLTLWAKMIRASCVGSIKPIGLKEKGLYIDKAKLGIFLKETKV